MNMVIWASNDRLDTEGYCKALIPRMPDLFGFVAFRHESCQERCMFINPLTRHACAIGLCTIVELNQNGGPWLAFRQRISNNITLTNAKWNNCIRFTNMPSDSMKQAVAFLQSIGMEVPKYHLACHSETKTTVKVAGCHNIKHIIPCCWYRWIHPYSGCRNFPPDFLIVLQTESPPGTHDYDSKRHDLMEGVSKCMISRHVAQAKFNKCDKAQGSHDEVYTDGSKMREWGQRRS